MGLRERIAKRIYEYYFGGYASGGDGELRDWAELNVVAKDIWQKEADKILKEIAGVCPCCDGRGYHYELKKQIEDTTTFECSQCRGTGMPDLLTLEEIKAMFPITDIRGWVGVLNSVAKAQHIKTRAGEELRRKQ